jgi:hypothetical protein
MSAPIEYRFVCDDEYVLTTLRRQRGQMPRARLQVLLTGFVTLFLLLGGVSMLWKHDWFGGTALTIGVVIVWASQPLGDHLALRRFRNSPVRGLETSVVLDEHVLRAGNSMAQEETGWNMLPKARVFADGVLLEGVEKHLRWLPHAALVSGTPEEVESLLREKVADFAALRSRAARG